MPVALIVVQHEVAKTRMFQKANREDVLDFSLEPVGCDDDVGEARKRPLERVDRDA